MAKHFGANNMHNGYAAMGNSLQRPRHKGVRSRSVAQAIAAARASAAKQSRISAGKKK
jgi:hypothetical protein